MLNWLEIKNWFKTPFHLLDSARNRLLFVVGVLVFSLSFLYLFVPFNINHWVSYPAQLEFFGLAGFGFIGFIVCAFMQFIVRPLFKIVSFNRIHLLLWFVMDLIFVTILLSILYGDPESSLVNEFSATLKFSFLIFGLWYLLGISLLAAINKSVDENLESLNDSELINFKDESGQIKFSVQRSNLIYLESASNYLMVFYKMDDEVKREMVRNTLKNIQEEMEACNIIRCHRSYMVNMQNVIFARKDGRNYVLKLQQVINTIPVSRNYIPLFKELLDN